MPSSKFETVEDINNFFDEIERKDEEYKTTITHNRERAHQVLNTINNIFDDFNKTGFFHTSKVLLKIFQKDMQNGLILIKYLKTKEPNDTLDAYHIFIGKCLIRLSSLIHADRQETPEEFSEWILLYK